MQRELSSLHIFMLYDRTMTATVYVIDRERNRILMHLHKKFGQLYPVGGHIEPHELPHEAALREVYEETGLHVSLSDSDGYPIESFDPFILPAPAFLLHENKNGPVQNLDFVYYAFVPRDFDPDEDMHPGKGESTRFFWLTAEEIYFGRITRDGEEIPVPPHIKRIADIAAKKFL